MKKSPRISPSRLFRFTETRAQCIVKDDEIRIAVLIPVRSFGMSYGSGGYTG